MTKTSLAQVCDNNRLIGGVAILVVLLMIVPASAADVSTGFTDGAGTATPDQFTGTAGDGWLGAWTGNGGTSSSVISTSPIDVGNYLSVTRNDSDANATLRRRFDLNGGDMVSGQPYDVEWTWRFDGSIAQMTGGGDRVHFFGDSAGRHGSMSSNSWLMGVSSSLNSSSGFNGGNFYFYDNAGTTAGGFTQGNMVNTGVALDALTAGDVFQFKVIVDPTQGSYDATITNTATGEAFTGANLKFRNASFDAATTQYVHFGSAANTGDDTTFSLDSIELTAHHNIVANFDDGNQANTIDTFNSSQAGGGWTGGWETVGSGLSGTVATANPLNGAGDPYLQVTSINTTSGDQNYEVKRTFENFGMVDVNQAHQISWQWRFDGKIADFEDSGDDRIHFFADHLRSDGSFSTNAWLIGAVSDRGGFVDGDFYFFDGNLGSSFSGSNTLPTGIALQPDVLYNFDVWVYPNSKTYDARITDEFGNSFSASGLGFRSKLTSSTGVTWDELHFGGNLNGSGDDQSFSLDSLSIRLIPEPATLLIWSLLAGLGVGLGWRRKS